MENTVEEAPPPSEEPAGEDGPVAVPIPRKPRICGTCGAEAKYRCPGCKQESCSVECVRAHKAESGCDGQARPQYVAVEDYSEEDMRQDYFFLESFVPKIWKKHRALPHHNAFSLETLPLPLHYLREACRFRGIHLTIMSSAMKRRRENLTRYNFKRETVMWHCDFVFHLASGEELRVGKLVNERFGIGDAVRCLVERRADKKLREHAVWNWRWELTRRRREKWLERVKQQTDADRKEAEERGESFREDAIGGKLTGTVRMWDDVKGFGFIFGDGDGLRDVWVSRKAIGGGSMKVGARVRFDLQASRSGRLQACNVYGDAVCDFGKAGESVTGFVDPTQQEPRWDPPVEKPPAKTADGKKPCAFYWRTGICKKGDRCAFAHIEPSEAARRGREEGVAEADGAAAADAPDAEDAKMAVDGPQGADDGGEEEDEEFGDVGDGDPALLEASIAQQMASQPAPSPETTADTPSTAAAPATVDSDDEDGPQHKTALEKWRAKLAAAREHLRQPETKAKILEFLEACQPHGGPAMVMQAERLGSTTAYEVLDTAESLAANLRRIKYVVERPIIEVYCPPLPSDMTVMTAELRDRQKEVWRPPAQPQPELTPAEAKRLRKVPCRHFFRRGRCNDQDNCRFMHCFELPMCKNLQNLGVCTLKDSCNFAHSRYDPALPENFRKIPRDLRAHFEATPRDRQRDVRDIRQEIEARQKAVEEITQAGGDKALGETVARLLKERADARQGRDFEKADSIRAELRTLGVEVQDREGTWQMRGRGGDLPLPDAKRPRLEPPSPRLLPPPATPAPWTLQLKGGKGADNGGKGWDAGKGFAKGRDDGKGKGFGWEGDGKGGKPFGWDGDGKGGKPFGWDGDGKGKGFGWDGDGKGGKPFGDGKGGKPFGWEGDGKGGKPFGWEDEGRGKGFGWEGDGKGGYWSDAKGGKSVGPPGGKDGGFRPGWDSWKGGKGMEKGAKSARPSVGDEVRRFFMQHGKGATSRRPDTGPPDHCGPKGAAVRIGSGSSETFAL